MYVTRSLPRNQSNSNLTYQQLEWLTSLPWPKQAQAPTADASSSSTSSGANALTSRTFLTNARAQLDADHFGLEKIKRRLIEYLAVVRLKEINALKEKERAVLALTAQGGGGDAKAIVGPVSNQTPAPVPAPKRKAGVNKGPILLYADSPSFPSLHFLICSLASFAQTRGPTRLRQDLHCAIGRQSP